MGGSSENQLLQRLCWRASIRVKRASCPHKTQYVAAAFPVPAQNSPHLTQAPTLRTCQSSSSLEGQTATTLPPPASSTTRWVGGWAAAGGRGGRLGRGAVDISAGGPLLRSGMPRGCRGSIWHLAVYPAARLCVLCCPELEACCHGEVRRALQVTPEQRPPLAVANCCRQEAGLPAGAQLLQRSYLRAGEQPAAAAGSSAAVIDSLIH